MKRLKEALENLDDAISLLQDQLNADGELRREARKKDAEFLKLSRAREAGVLAVAQKAAMRLEQAIDNVDSILRN